MNLNLPEGTKEVGGTLGGLGTVAYLMKDLPEDQKWIGLVVMGTLALGFVIARAAFKPGRGRGNVR